jgi:hypothetical protein
MNFPGVGYYISMRVELHPRSYICNVELSVVGEIVIGSIFIKFL